MRFDRAALLRFTSQVRRRLARGREFSVCIASDAALRGANSRFLKKDHVTDVLSFPAGEGLYLGDILISAARAERQAARLGHSVDQELKLLVLHGVLHLLGYDHERDDGAMSRAEQAWRRRLDLPAGLIERGARR